ncbi:MAG: type II toxin-antitoxin system RelE/ParE family toxin [Hyphomicrobiales bacterium]|nr:type II toxin-antitoxin system RelE/ParE family toxin [Hyphomicrobiales bacterium]MBV8664037.1 type II toxin-antitoxin system RelE/ParE family toxin [Hyphomicrobiales bacterium]
MIKTWSNSATRRFAEDGKSKFAGLDADAAVELLAALNAAISLDDLSPLKSVGLHKLGGDRKGQWAMTINGPWRLCFRFRDGDAWDVEIADYH